MTSVGVDSQIKEVLPVVSEDEDHPLPHVSSIKREEATPSR